VDFAISTKTCGQVCGLSLRERLHARCKREKVGCDQILSRIFRCANRRLRKRIGLRAGRRRERATLGRTCGLV
jgi:hypothetical protein